MADSDHFYLYIVGVSVFSWIFFFTGFYTGAFLCVCGK